MNSNERQEVVIYRIKRAKETFSEIDILIENRLYSTAVNRMYYACYYAVIALLLSKEISTQTHSGVRQMFGLHFVKSGLIDRELGKFYSEIHDKRQTGDYDDFISFTEDDVVGMKKPANDLIEAIEKLLIKQ